MCAIDTIKDCEDAAKELRLADATPTALAVANTVSGCSIDSKGLVFNSKGPSKPASNQQVVCKPCPYVSPYCTRQKIKMKSKVIRI